MPPKQWPHLNAYTDRHGKDRAYFRPTGSALPVPVGSPAFQTAYAAELSNWTKRKAPMRTVKQGGPDSVAAVVAEYKASVPFIKLAAESKRAYHRHLDWLVEQAGPLPIAGINRIAINAMLAAQYKIGAGTYNLFLAVLRVVIRHAISTDRMTADPTLKIPRMDMGEHRSWTDEECAAFEARWPIGSRERLAYGLALYTGQRLGDVAAMTWAAVDRSAGEIAVIQEKTGTKLRIPIHAELLEILAAHPRTTIAIVTQSDGTRLGKARFSRWMHTAIMAAGIGEGVVFHGLRKRAAVKLGEAGCSAKEIAAVTGHKSLKEVERYTRETSQIRLATQAMRKVAK